MLKSEPTDFNPLSAISVQLRQCGASLIQCIAHKPMARVSLLVVLGLGSISWLGTAAIAPQSAHAYTANVEVSLSRQSRESFQSFLRRAEAVARAAAQRSFDRDILVSYVAVTVVGQNNGAITPVLKLNVSRRAWRNRPDPQRWITYLPNTESLLGFNRTTGEPEIPEPTPTQNRQPTQQRRQQPSVRQPPQTIINIPGANIRLVPPPPQPTTLPPGAAGANPNNPNGGAGTNNFNGGARTNNPNGGAGTNNFNGGAGTNNSNGGAGTNNPNGGAGTNNFNGGAGTNNFNGGAGTNNFNGGSSNQSGGSGTNTP